MDTTDEKPPKNLTDARAERIAWRDRHRAHLSTHGLELKLLRTAPELEALETKVRAWCHRMIYGPPEKRHFILVGPTGTGKSHTALAAKDYLADALLWAWRGELIIGRMGVAMINAPEIVDMSDDHFGYWLEGLAHKKVLFLEDIGTETDQYRSGLPRKRLYQVLEHFAGQWLFITTNVPEEGWIEKWDARVEDRLHRSADIAVLKEVPSFTVWKMGRRAIAEAGTPNLNLGTKPRIEGAVA